MFGKRLFFEPTHSSDNLPIGKKIILEDEISGLNYDKVLTFRSGH
jgi:hypothetical protein